MPPKSDVWESFDTLLGADGKPMKYLNDRSHLAAWCRGCVEYYVGMMMALEHEQVLAGDLPEARGRVEWLKSGTQTSSYQNSLILHLSYNLKPKTLHLHLSQHPGRAQQML